LTELSPSLHVRFTRRRHRVDVRTVTLPHLPRALVLNLLDELVHGGASQSFWDRFWRLAPHLHAEECEFVRRAAQSPWPVLRRVPLHI